ncbi:hypothetical protein SAMD00019534_021340, partial [Acytostelium subglobosum LB1]|uniref:hypothetical protein n=1 Tax=Acytostelium subglobosum LB1 TaxID=1410327 RepID=UPI000644E779
KPLTNLYEFPSPLIPKLFYFMLFYVFGTYRPYMPIYLKSINFTPAVIGLTLFFPPFVTFLAGPTSSALCDRFKCHRIVITVASSCSALIILSLYFVSNHALAIMIVILNSLVWAPIIPILDSTTYKILGSARDVYGKQRMFGSIGFGLSAALIGVIATHYNNNRIYWINYIINQKQEIVFFFYGKQIINRVGVIKMIALSHVLLIIRVTYYIFVLVSGAKAWVVLPVELLHGIIFASSWSAGSRLCSDLTPKGLEATGQSLIYCVYMGLGLGFGSLFGGLIYESLGPVMMYVIIAIQTSIGLCIFLGFQYFYGGPPGGHQQITTNPSPLSTMGLSKDSAKLLQHNDQLTLKLQIKGEEENGGDEEEDDLSYLSLRSSM